MSSAQPGSDPAVGPGSSVVGVDVGGTKVAVGRLEDETLGGLGVRRTEASSADGLVDELVAAIESARSPDTQAVGAGVPSVVEFATGRVRSSVNLPLADFDLRNVLEERLGLPVFVDNDATVAALGEAFDDGGRAVVQNLIMFTVGTGVGGGLVLGGRVYRGSSGAAGELGHTMIGADLAHGAPERGDFPQQGSLEALAAGRVLDHLGAGLVTERPDSALAKLAAEGEHISGHDVVQLANEGDPDAVGALRLVGERLGVGIANAINTFDPDEVVVGGGVSVAGELLLGPAREVARRFVLTGLGQRTDIRLARHGRNAGVRGAALLAKLELAEGDAAFAPPRSEVESRS
jgi:glucokinase